MRADLSLPADPASVARFRRFVGATVREWRLDALQDTAELLVSELVTNSVTFAGTPVQVVVERSPSRLRVAVSDGSAGAVAPLAVAPEDEHGRGLLMVEMLAAAWGSFPLPTGKTVWFELAVPADGQGAA